MNTIKIGKHVIEIDIIPLSLELVKRLNDLEDEYHSYLDWDYPPNPSPWSKEQKEDFVVNNGGADFDIKCR